MRLEQEKFITSKPDSVFLQQYISYYYFHDSLDDSLIKRFVYYPNSKNALTIYKNSSVDYQENHSRTQPDTTEAYSFLYSGVQCQFRTAEILAPFHKVGIVFQELGINHFIDVPLSNISNDPIQKSFNYFGDDLINTCDIIYSVDDIKTKVGLLDQFFERKFCNFQEDTLKECLTMIGSATQKYKVADLSHQLNVSRKTLLRLFTKHLCCTVKDYIDIIQFRRALNSYLLINNQSSFTEVALDNEYYDQAQFINHFKKLTGINPKKFFKNVAHLGQEDTFWTMQ